jgi:CubicO group peptidase (beta-lactamase class C family)
MMGQTDRGRRNVRRHGIHHLLIAAVLVAAPALVYAQAEPVSLDDRAALAAWTDGTVEALLEANHTAGGVVTIVRNGEVVHAKGYGYADVAERAPVDPETTLFRIASVSKLFTWTSVMQLIEQGRIDLNSDVNQYLDKVRVPKRYDQAVTMKHLLTHTSGFEDQVLGLFSHDPADMRPLEEILREEMPARVREPGKYASYSNHGTGLAMHVVERIYGAPWEKYVQANILDPLGLKNTVLAQPVPEPFAASVSKGYSWKGGRLEEQEFELVPMGPVGGISTTGLDMAAFMLMFLNEGELNGARILEPETVKTMEATLHTMAPGVNGQAYGMLDMSQRGIRIVGHDGDTFWFHSSFALFPEDKTGVFVSFNSDTGAMCRSQFVEAFVRRFYQPKAPEKLTPPEGFGARVAKYTGSFRANRFSHRTLAKLGYALNPVTVRDDGKGALLISFTGGKRWIEVGPHTFQDEDSDRKIVFIQDEDGTFNHFVFSDVGIVAYERNNTLGNPGVHLMALLGTVLLCLLGIVCWPVAAIMRWKHDVIVSRGDLISVPARVLGWATCVAVLGFMVLFIMASADPLQVAFGMPPLFIPLLIAPLVIALLTLGMIGAMVRQWTAGNGTIPARLAYTLLTLALSVFVFQTIFWNLTIVQNIRFL